MKMILVIASFLLACSDDEESSILSSSSYKGYTCSKCSFSGSVEDLGNNRAKATIKASDGKEFTKEFAVPEACKGQKDKWEFAAMDLTNQAISYCGCTATSSEKTDDVDYDKTDNTQADPCTEALISSSFSFDPTNTSGDSGLGNAPLSDSGSQGVNSTDWGSDYDSSGYDSNGQGTTSGTDFGQNGSGGDGTTTAGTSACDSYMSQDNYQQWGDCYGCEILGKPYNGAPCE